MFMLITLTESSINETNKTQQKVRGTKFMFKMSTIYVNTCIQMTTPLRNHCRDDGVVQQPPLTPSHHGSGNSRPSLEIYPRCCSPPDSVWRIGWPRLYRDKIWRLSLQHGDSVTCTVNDMISVMSTLCH